jgi:hypothetical protein
MKAIHSVVRMSCVAAVLSVLCVRAQTGIDTTGTFLVVSNNGSDVWNQTGNAIYAVDNATGSSTLLVNSTRLPSVGSYYSPSFSPDGRSICFFGGNSIYIANNDGTGIQKVCDSYNSRSGRPSWSTTGHIWWSENTNAVYRVNVSSKTREIYWPNCPAQGHDEVIVEQLTVSVDGTRGESNGNGKVNSLDLVNKLVVAQPVGGCAGAISFDGQYMVIQGTSPTTPGSDGGFNGTWLKDFATGATVAYVNLVAGAKAYYHSGSKNNTDFFVARSLDGTYLNGAILGKFSTQQSKAVFPSSGAWIPSDFWCGPLPGAVQTPVVALNKTLLTFTSSGTNPAAQTVTVSNAGAGTLSAVTVARRSTWLTVTRTGSGNDQTLTNAVDVTGLADGAYQDTVTVSGGGASNTVSYAVNLTIGSAPAVPSDLAAVVTQGVQSSSVTLTWSDNSTNETWFYIERQVASGSWGLRAQVNADITTYTDTGLAANSYSYRVRARNSNGTSLPSNVATLSVALQPYIALLSPLPPAQLTVGETVTLSWNALNMTSVVIEYSIDDGETYHLMPGLAGQLEPTDPRWNNFQWQVPSSPLNAVYINIASYVTRTVHDAQGPYPLVGSAVAPHARQRDFVQPRIVQPALRPIANADALANAPLIRLYRLDGSALGVRQPAGGACAVLRVLAPGVYLGRGE